MLALTTRRPADVGLREIAAYGLGDFCFNIIWTMMLSYLIYYYTEVCHIAPAVAGAIVLAARFTNVILDPVVGVWVDRRPSGRKARPFVLWGAAPLGVLCWLAFTVGDAAPAARNAWAALTYVALCAGYSLVNTPYGALTTLISPKERDRGRLAVSRMAGATIGMLVVGSITLPLVDVLRPGDRIAGFAWVAAVYGLALAVGLLFTGRLCAERTPGEPIRAPASAIVRGLARNRRWAVITLSMCFYLVAQTFLFGMMPYYMVEVIRASDENTGLLLTALNLAFLAGSLLALPLAARIGSRLALFIGAVAGGALLVILDALHPTLAAAAAVLSVSGLLLGVAAPMSYVLLAASADSGSGGSADQQLAGVCYAANSAASKISFGLGGYLLSFMLSLTAYPRPWLASRGFVDVSAIMFVGSGLIILLFPGKARVTP